MTEQLPFDSEYDNDNGFIGKHVDIRLASDEVLSSKLASYDVVQTYLDITDEDALPYPARSVNLESWYENTPATPVIKADIDFRPTALENAANTWPNAFLEELSSTIQSYNYDTATQSHDTTACYISLDASNSIRIGLSSTAHECTISISLEQTSAINNATHEPLPIPFTDQELPLVEKLRHIVTILGVSIDTLRDYYGQPPKHFKQYPLEQYRLPKELERTPPQSPHLRGQPHKIELEGVQFDIGTSGIDSVGGATHAKQRLKEFADIMNHPEVAAQFDIARSHFVLHGPPGTGKTTLVNALSQEIGATLLAISSTDVIDKYVGESGKQLKQAFDQARASSGKTVMFFDEFDALARKNSRDTRDIVKVLNVELEDIAKNHPNIIVAAAMNADIDDVEPSLIRSGRIEPIGVPLPTENERFDIFGLVLYKSIRRTTPEINSTLDSDAAEQHSSAFMLYDQAIDIRELATAASGMTGADFEVVLERARKKHFMHFRKTGEYNSVTQQDLLREIKHFGR